MIRNRVPKYLLMGLLGIQVSCNYAQPGNTGPQAVSYDCLAETDDNSSVYDIPIQIPEWTKLLDDQIPETSGLILLDGILWTINDDSDTRLYMIDTASAKIVGHHLLQGVVNRDWEEICMDDSYIYIGDFGNNSGTREDLHILRIEKLSLISGHPSIDTIWFRYIDQTSFVAKGLNQTEFDCEAFLVATDSIYLFTKQWISGFTSLYVLPKYPGSYTAQKRGVFDTGGQITGASFLEEERMLVLCGYTGLTQPFMYLFYDYPNDDFFSGVGKRVNIALPFHQVEGIATQDGIHYFISNESIATPFANIPQKLHKIDLSILFKDYLKGFLEFD